MDGNLCDRMLVLRAPVRRAWRIQRAGAEIYARRVMKLSMRYTRDRADAEDAVQNTFIKAYWGLKNFRSEDCLLFLAASHRDQLRKERVVAARAHAELFVSNGRNADDTNDASPALKDLDTPEELALTEEIRTAVSASIDALCEEQRTRDCTARIGGAQLFAGSVRNVLSGPVPCARACSGLAKRLTISCAVSLTMAWDGQGTMCRRGRAIPPEVATLVLSYNRTNGPDGDSLSDDCRCQAQRKTSLLLFVLFVFHGRPLGPRRPTLPR